MTSEILKYCISKKNQELWKRLDSECDILVLSGDEPNFRLSYGDFGYTIYVDEDNLLDASFTHELLHIDIKERGILFSKYLTDSIGDDSDLNYLFSKDLEDHITNCLEHSKLVDEFVEMGYNRNLYLTNYNSKHLSKNHLINIKETYKKEGYYEREFVDAFIGHLFAGLFDVNPKHNYKSEYRILKSIDKVLFELIVAFKNDWDTYDFNNPEDDYEEIIDLFIDDLKGWVLNKTVV